jgi:hypothetical protein
MFRFSGRKDPKWLQRGVICFQSLHVSFLWRYGPEMVSTCCNMFPELTCFVSLAERTRNGYNVMQHVSRAYMFRFYDRKHLWLQHHVICFQSLHVSFQPIK